MGTSCNRPTARAAAAHGRMGTLVLLISSLATLLVVSPASAARFHVATSGTRVAGESLPGDWTDANCYPRLALALQAASAADTVLLSREDHRLDAAATLRTLLANRDFDAQPGLCRVVLGTVGTLQVDASATEATLRGLAFAAAETASTHPAVQIASHGEFAATVVIEACRFSAWRATRARRPEAGRSTLSRGRPRSR